MDPNVLNMLRPIILEAGKIMRRAHEHRMDSSILVKPGDANFVTEYDFQVQEYLMKEITKVMPDAVFIAEEKTNDPAVLAADRCFIIDPIDGTTNFIHNFRHSAISVAMVSHGEVVFGAVYDPYLDELFHAVKGGGAFVNGHPIHAANYHISNALVVFGTCPYYKEATIDRTFSLCRALFLKCGDLRRSGSAALDLAYLAAGRCDAFFEFILSPWDYAAGSLLITEAGGVVTDMHGAPLRFGEPSSVLAATSGIHGELLETVKPMM